MTSKGASHNTNASHNTSPSICIYSKDGNDYTSGVNAR